ncbi:hypothetical protein [Streptomyces sp. NPDC059466]|uniref:hypothetical protein n=1 Tax=unclassified Streptomyces TaxID=2593676 RepID=UPI0036B47806
MSSEHGPWQTVYGPFRRWQRDGTWSVLLSRLQARADAAGLITWEVNVDSTVCPLASAASVVSMSSMGAADNRAAPFFPRPLRLRPAAHRPRLVMIDGVYLRRGWDPCASRC